MQAARFSPAHTHTMSFLQAQASPSCQRWDFCGALRHSIAIFSFSLLLFLPSKSRTLCPSSFALRTFQTFSTHLESNTRPQIYSIPFRLPHASSTRAALSSLLPSNLPACLFLGDSDLLVPLHLDVKGCRCWLTFVSCAFFAVCVIYTKTTAKQKSRFICGFHLSAPFCVWNLIHSRPLIYL